LGAQVVDDGLIFTGVVAEVAGLVAGADTEGEGAQTGVGIERRSRGRRQQPILPRSDAVGIVAHLYIVTGDAAVGINIVPFHHTRVAVGIPRHVDPAPIRVGGIHAKRAKVRDGAAVSGSIDSPDVEIPPATAQRAAVGEGIGRLDGVIHIVGGNRIPGVRITGDVGIGRFPHHADSAVDPCVDFRDRPVQCWGDGVGGVDTVRPQVHGIDPVAGAVARHEVEVPVAIRDGPQIDQIAGAGALLCILVGARIGHAVEHPRVAPHAAGCVIPLVRPGDPDRRIVAPFAGRVIGAGQVAGIGRRRPIDGDVIDGAVAGQSTQIRNAELDGVEGLRVLVEGDVGGCHHLRRGCAIHAGNGRGEPIPDPACSAVA